ncbi:hypothetical protein BC835DRAFT_170423 [Cytidiella melzeri]|nr:hypothetical protein BC835DRAFT_170423 [Cytidiella melzeri]
MGHPTHTLLPPHQPYGAHLQMSASADIQGGDFQHVSVHRRVEYGPCSCYACRDQYHAYGHGHVNENHWHERSHLNSAFQATQTYFHNNTRHVAQSVPFSLPPPHSSSASFPPFLNQTLPRTLANVDSHIPNHSLINLNGATSSDRRPPYCVHPGHAAPPCADLRPLHDDKLSGHTLIHGYNQQRIVHSRPPVLAGCHLHLQQCSSINVSTASAAHSCTYTQGPPARVPVAASSWLAPNTERRAVATGAAINITHQPCVVCQCTPSMHSHHSELQSLSLPPVTSTTTSQLQRPQVPHASGRHVPSTVYATQSNGVSRRVIQSESRELLVEVATSRSQLPPRLRGLPKVTKNIWAYPTKDFSMNVKRAARTATAVGNESRTVVVRGDSLQCSGTHLQPQLHYTPLPALGPISALADDEDDSLDVRVTEWKIAEETRKVIVREIQRVIGEFERGERDLDGPMGCRDARTPRLVLESNSNGLRQDTALATWSDHLKHAQQVVNKSQRCDTEEGHKIPVVLFTYRQALIERSEKNTLAGRDEPKESDFQMHKFSPGKPSHLGPHYASTEYAKHMQRIPQDGTHQVGMMMCSSRKATTPCQPQLPTTGSKSANWRLRTQCSATSPVLRRLLPRLMTA